MLKKISYVMLICLRSLFGVFGIEHLSVMEGDPVTLSVSLNESQREERISWKFTSQEINASEIIIAETEDKGNNVSLHEERADGRFRDRLELNNQTGSLIITNTSITHTGLYQVNTIRTSTHLKTFNLTVYARLPVPVISRVSPQCSSSSSNCVLLCSVMNVRDVSLSWYKGNSLLSIISVSDLNISLSLPLEVDDQDNNTYSCVLNNPINQTKHLNITHLCQPCSGINSLSIVVICCVALGSLIIVTAVLVWIYRKHKNTQQQVQSGGEEIIYADTSFHKRQTHKPEAPVEDDVVYAGVMRR